MMHRARVFGLIVVLVTCGCAGVKSPPPAAPTSSNPPQAAAEPVPPASASTTPSTAASTGKAAPATTPPTAAKASPPAAPPTAAKAALPIAKAPAKSAATAAAAPAAQAPKKENPPPVVAKPAAAPLNLSSLEQRLKDTQAIGVMTKISLKNQVDELLDKFRAFYQGKLKTTVAELRRSYDLLFLKVLSLLQDSDPALAAAIAASREAIWGILSDPAKFATI